MKLLIILIGFFILMALVIVCTLNVCKKNKEWDRKSKEYFNDR